MITIIRFSGGGLSSNRASIPLSDIAAKRPSHPATPSAVHVVRLRTAAASSPRAIAAWRVASTRSTASIAAMAGKPSVTRVGEAPGYMSFTFR